MKRTSPVLPKTACRVSPLTGRVVRGLPSARHDNGEVTIDYAGLQLRGRALSPEDVLEIEPRGGTS